MVRMEALNGAAAGVGSAGSAFDSYLDTKAKIQGEERKQAESGLLQQRMQLGIQQLEGELSAFEQDRENAQADREGLQQAAQVGLDALEGANTWLPPAWLNLMGRAREVAATSGPAGTKLLQLLHGMMGAAAVEHHRGNVRQRIADSASEVRRIQAELMELDGGAPGGEMHQVEPIEVDVTGDGQADFAISDLAELPDLFAQAIDTPGSDPGKIEAAFEQALGLLRMRRSELVTRMTNYNNASEQLQQIRGTPMWTGSDQDFEESLDMLSRYRSGEKGLSSQRLRLELVALQNGQKVVDVPLPGGAAVPVWVPSATFRSDPQGMMRTLGVLPSAPEADPRMKLLNDGVGRIASALRGLSPEEMGPAFNDMAASLVDQINLMGQVTGMPDMPNAFRAAASASGQTQRPGGAGGGVSAGRPGARGSAITLQSLRDMGKLPDFTAKAQERFDQLAGTMGQEEALAKAVVDTAAAWNMDTASWTREQWAELLRAVVGE